MMDIKACEAYTFIKERALIVLLKLVLHTLYSCTVIQLYIMELYSCFYHFTVMLDF